MPSRPVSAACARPVASSDGGAEQDAIARQTALVTVPSARPPGLDGVVVVAGVQPAHVDQLRAPGLDIAGLVGRAALQRRRRRRPRSTAAETASGIWQTGSCSAPRATSSRRRSKPRRGDHGRGRTKPGRRSRETAVRRSSWPPDGKVMTDFASITKVNWRALPSGIRSVYFEVSSRGLERLVADLEPAQPFDVHVALNPGRKRRSG